jgi:hypothetical protein
MKKLLLIVVVAAIGWSAYDRSQRGPERESQSESEGESDLAASDDLLPERSATTAAFACDGRTHCSQMKSCAEARYFINHCPGTKMDGDDDGVPCESQWCN